MRLIAFAVPLFAVALAAQSPSQTPAAGTAPAFEVASVKVSKSSTPMMSMRMLPTSFNATNVTVQMLLTMALRIRQFQIQGAPAWLNTDRFDINAKAPEGTPPDQLMSMVKSLLADRFKLVSHNETKESPIYALVMARSDGKFGPKLSKTTDDCETIMAERRAAARAGGPGPTLFTPPPITERPICTINMGSAPQANGRFAMRFRGGGQPIDTIVRQIEGLTDRLVVNRTGLMGLYDFDLEFVPQFAGASLATGGISATGQTAAAPPIDDGPTIFDAVQQLGMKLESTRGPVEYLVIDSVEKPTDD
ncbi:MAG TPA: TIGR03435 family protein [Vicinamibacterales bacterium]|jgi:uncharacterized protein (TIGR03435 family)